jgi:hypothetical protein
MNFPYCNQTLNTFDKSGKIGKFDYCSDHYHTQEAKHQIIVPGYDFEFFEKTNKCWIYYTDTLDPIKVIENTIKSAKRYNDLKAFL